MGALFAFRCPDCGYRAEVSGGDDAGMIASTTTVTCSECRKLYDITTGWHAETAHRKQPKFRCPKGADHHIERWKAGGPCPVCGAAMRNDGETLLWD
jgi:hypothetical protein